MLLKNFLLSRAKSELSPQLKQLSKTPTGNINRAVKKVIAEIDNIVLEHEGETAKEYLKTKRRYQALQTVLSFLVHEGYSQVRQDRISKKSGISKPLINDILSWLEDLGVCQQIKTRRNGKKSPSIYILTLHNNYLKIIEYFKTKWSLLIEVTSTFTEQLKKKISHKDHSPAHAEDTPKVLSKGIEHFNLEGESKQANETKKFQNATDRKEDLEEYLSEDQKRTYQYILIQKLTNLSERDAYVIANRMPSNIGEDAWYYFEQCVKSFKQISADESNPAYFIEIFNQQYKAFLDRQKRKAKEENTQKRGFNFHNSFKNFRNFLTEK
ncbi:Replicase RepFR55 (plasmid) [Bacillus thuringiensis LM1212]|uniref:hypothetical protein n=1 Tax=Bacillus cereus group TaxID=86661 RepID=UPI0004070A9E|nr:MULTISPECIES: hypothetical protein [Bacillus cereus group]AXY11575.1 Replicase RepFR55 [Bacillus thuringiensis LM1212]QDF27456.1 Replicase RepFR55 [Bacillus tropicus]QUG99335.1 Replicase RepFR55 [Bacillus tropicus]